MKFGIFDHMDRGALPLGEQYEDRLELIEAYERAGFHAYHLAEHHATPLGMAPSPSVFLAAVAQRTRRLRFGPLVYTLPLYHPLRLAEEICMLDQMSGGRLELGIGRGVSPHEFAYYGADPDPNVARETYFESFAILMKALTGGTLTFEGKVYTFRDVPIELEPVQRPHPPLWYGASDPAAVPWAAQNRVNIVCNGPVEMVRGVVERYRTEWRAAGRKFAELPLMGMTRHVVIADTDEEATEIARRGYQRWYASFILLWDQHGTKPFRAAYPNNFDDAARMGFAVAGTPETVRDVLAGQIAESGVNYFLCRFAFGDLTLAETQRSVELFSNSVMPGLIEAREAAE
jgi:alkanesulfonate monooxygenase SsuD/methylene tetrahydromethanopterin reductase-like flavin-dependent oxidoreductase (luciferase family)